MPVFAFAISLVHGISSATGSPVTTMLHLIPGVGVGSRGVTITHLTHSLVVNARQWVAAHMSALSGAFWLGFLLPG